MYNLIVFAKDVVYTSRRAEGAAAGVYPNPFKSEEMVYTSGRAKNWRNYFLLCGPAVVVYIFISRIPTSPPPPCDVYDVDSLDRTHRIQTFLDAEKRKNMRAAQCNRNAT